MAAQGQQIASMFARIGADISELQQAMGEVQSQLGKGEKSFDKFGLSGVINIAKITAALAALKKGYNFLQEGAQLARLEDAGASLARSYGANMNQILGALKTASRGTVAETDLILSANRAMMLGVSTDADQMANLLEVAALRGRSMGLSTTQAFNDIVTGIGRMSPLILDNLGIVTNLSARVEEWAKKNGVAADSVDDATKRQILLNAVLEEGNKQLAETGGLADDAASSYERLAASTTDAWNRLKTQVGIALEPVVGYLADAQEEQNRLNAAIELMGARLHNLPLEQYRLMNGEVVELNELLAMSDKLMEQAFAAERVDAAMMERLFGGASGAAAAAGAEAGDAFAASFSERISGASVSSLQGVMEDIKYSMAGGAELAGQVRFIDELVAANSITDEQAREMYGAALTAAVNIETSLGNMNLSEARETIMNSLGIPLDEAQSKSEGVLNNLTALAGSVSEAEAIVNLQVTGDTWIASLIGGRFVGFLNGNRVPGGGGSRGMGGSTAQPEMRALGGLIEGDNVYSVGENGEEGVIPLGNGAYWVIPNQEWMKMKKAGAVPTAGFANGGPLLDGVAGVGAVRSTGYARRVDDYGPFGGPGMMPRLVEDEYGRYDWAGNYAPIGGRAQDSTSGSSTNGTQAAAQAAAAAAVGVGTSVAAQQAQSNMAVIGALTRQSSEESQRLNLSLEELRLAVERLPLSIAAEISHELAIRNAQ